MRYKQGLLIADTGDSELDMELSGYLAGNYGLQ